ncbi:MAG TPA: MauE/DoxX family redox-associated membrane protein [Polyangiaceae bacterium]|nr:MauE/DoxX family redox-associated membrane protein [Polyangiaceae bacterium]
MSHIQLAHLLLRAILGLNLTAHALARLPRVSAFANQLTGDFHAVPLPAWAVSAFAHVVPFAELAIGLAVLLGVKLPWALVAGGALLGVLTFGACLAEMWEVAGLQLVYALVYAVLLAGAAHARFVVLS